MNSRAIRNGLGVLLTGFALASCAEREVFSPQDVNALVVDAVLVVGQEFPVIRLSRTQGQDGIYSIPGSGEFGATISIQYPGGAVAYQDLGDSGWYGPGGGPVTVQAATTHHLRVESSQGEVVTATTTTPPQFDVTQWLLLDNAGVTINRQLRTFAELGNGVFGAPENQIVYSQGLLEARFAQGVNPNGYQITVDARDPTDFVIDVSGLTEDELDDFDAVIASPVFEAENRSFRLPWFAVFYTGRYVIRAWSLDHNWRELVTSIPEFDDGGGNFGGNIGDGVDRPDFNIEGGIGLFGSASVDSIGLTIVRPTP